MSIDSFISKFTYTLEDIPVELIDESWCLLRNLEKNNAGYDEIKESIRAQGVHVPLILRRIFLNDGKNVILSLIDGHHRLECAKEVGVKQVPCKILDNCSDDDALAIQVVCNHPFLATKKANFATQIKLILERKGNLSVADLARMLSLNVNTIYDYISLTKLPKEVQLLIDTGKISLMNAIQLAKLPEVDYKNGEWIQKAQDLGVTIFSALVKDKLNASRLSRKSEKVKVSPDPKPRYRTQSELLKEIKEPKLLLQIAKDNSNLSVIEALKEGVRFALSMDSKTYKKRVEEIIDLIKKSEETHKELLRQEAAKKIQDLQSKIESERPEANKKNQTF